MAGTNYVYSQPLPPVSFTNLTATPQTFKVNVHGYDTLFLDTAFTAATGTAFVVTLAASDGMNAAGVPRTLTVTDYSAKTFTDATFTYTSSVSFNRVFALSVTGLALTASSTGNITVSVSATAGTTDSVVITPMVARTGG